MKEEYKIKWIKLVLPNEKEDDDEEGDDDDDFSYNEEETQPRFQIAQILGGGENPFVQLKTFNFWTAHTNFRVTRDLALLINNSTGVESIDVITAYRFHISVGHLFEESDVKRTVYNTCVEYLNEQKQQPE